MRPAADIGQMLARAIEAQAHRQGCAVRVETMGMTRWSSATFNGARHRLRLAAPAGDKVGNWLAGLAEHEFALRGHLVADVAIHAINRRPAEIDAELEILTLEDR